MARWPFLTLIVLLCCAASVARAQTGGGKTSSSLPSISGVVKALSASSLTLERNGVDAVFRVSSSTRVLAKGGRVRGPGDYPNGAHDLVLRSSPTLEELLKPGDRVTVRFRRSGSTLQAVELLVATP